MASVRQASAARKVSSHMCHVCMRSSARRDPAPHTSSMRDSPRLVASAIRVARKACSSPGGNPVATCPKCCVKPVHRSTCDRPRSEERLVGKECVFPCLSLFPPFPLTINFFFSLFFFFFFFF